MDERGDIDFAGAYGRRVRGTYGAGEKRIINYKHAAPMELRQAHFVLIHFLGALGSYLETNIANIPSFLLFTFATQNYSP